MIHTRSLRSRMMLLFSAVVGVLLAVSYLGFYVLLRGEVRVQLDRQLLETARPVIADLITDPKEQDINQLKLPDTYFELLDASGRVLQRSVNLQGRPLNLGATGLDSERTLFRTVEDGNRGRLRLALIPFRPGRETLVLALATPTRATSQVLESFGRIILLLLPLSLLLTAAISGWYVGRSLAPIAALTRHATQMTERVANPEPGELWRPLAVPQPPDELGRLAETFNQLFARIDSALGQLRQFVSDASHELRTPLSVLQGEMELVLSEPRTTEEYQKTLHIIDDELKKLTRIVEGLFTLSMADAGQLRLAKDPLYLDEVLEEACALAGAKAQAKNIAIEPQLKQEVAYLGDEAFLRQLFLVFLDNAIKYSPPHTCVRVSLMTEDGVARAHFQDQGIGISSEHLQRIFERFYRVVQPGAGEAQSGGLGLAIAQAIARAQGGSIECRSTPGAGSTFIVTLPLPDTAQSSSRTPSLSPSKS